MKKMQHNRIFASLQLRRELDLCFYKNRLFVITFRRKPSSATLEEQNFCIHFSFSACLLSHTTISLSILKLFSAKPTMILRLLWLIKTATAEVAPSCQTCSYLRQYVFIKNHFYFKLLCFFFTLSAKIKICALNLFLFLLKFPILLSLSLTFFELCFLLLLSTLPSLQVKDT